MKKKLYLHVGLSKTATTYLQHCFFINRSRLIDEGIYYPLPFDQDEKTFQVKGNATYTNGNLAKIIDLVNGAETDVSVLLSSESLLGTIGLTNDKTKKLIFTALKEDFDIYIILVIRDLFDHTVSLYSQVIRTYLVNCNIDDYFVLPWEDIALRGGGGSKVCSTVTTLRHIKRFLHSCHSFGLNLKIFDYDTYKSDLPTEIFNYLGIFDFQKPQSSIVNRSLTFTEIEIVRLFFKHYFSKSESLTWQKCHEIVLEATKQLDTMLTTARSENIKPRPLKSTVELWLSLIDEELSLVQSLLPVDKKLTVVPNPRTGTSEHISLNYQEINNVLSICCNTITKRSNFS